MRVLINAFSTALRTIFQFVPHFIGFLLLLLVGWLIGLGMERAVRLLLRNVGFHHLSDRIGLKMIEQRLGITLDLTRIVGQCAFWFVFLVFLVQATDALGLPTLSNTLNRMVAYLPNVFVAMLVLLLGSLVGIFAGDLVRGATKAASLGNPDLLANIVRWSIIGFSCLIALQQLEIASILITVLFTAIVGGIALAFGLSFGLGGREAVQRLLARSESAFLSRLPSDPEQIVQQAQADLAYSEQIEQHYRDTDPETDLPPLSELQPASPLSLERKLTTPRIEPHP